MKIIFRRGYLFACCLTVSVYVYAQDAAKVDSLLKKISKAREDTSKVNLLNILGNAYTNNHPDSTIFYSDQALIRAKHLQYTSGQANAYRNIGIAYDNLGKFQQSLQNYFTALKLFQQEKNARGIALTYNDIGIIYYELGQYDSAINCYSISLHMRDSLHEKKMLAAVYSNIGLVYYDLGNTDKALEQIFKALSIDEELGNKQGMADSYLNIGELYEEGDSIRKSNEFLLKALDLQHQTGDKEGMVHSYEDLGSNFAKEHDYSKALDYYFKGLTLAEEIGLRLKAGTIQGKIGDAYKGESNYRQAIEHHLTGLQILEALGEKRFIVQAHNNLGQIYALQKQTDKAIVELDSALQLANPLHLNQEIKKSYDELAKAYEMKNDFRKAYEYSKLSASINDSLMNEEKTKAILNLQTKYETQKKDEEIALLNAKTMLQESQNKKQRILRNAFIAGFILVVLIAFLLYNGFRRSKKSNAELASKSEVIQEQKRQVEETLGELKRSQVQLVLSEKMASLGQLTAGIAHEINNPINFVSANINPLKRNLSELKNLMEQYEQVISKSKGAETVEQLKKEFDKDFNIEESEKLMKGIEEGSTRTAEIVKGLRNFSRLDTETMKKSNINDGIESTLVLLQNKLKQQNIEVVKSTGDLPEINCYPAQLDQVYMNLLTNAIDAVGSDAPNKTGERKIFVTTCEFLFATLVPV
ncbi:MAG TPA: tetratricopeptide repeat protein [Chitinophagales bacterium]|nr:tetratricopeptide repeat protein [Chitinophagales bacterium]